MLNNTKTKRRANNSTNSNCSCPLWWWRRKNVIRLTFLQNRFILDFKNPTHFKFKCLCCFAVKSPPCSNHVTICGGMLWISLLNLWGSGWTLTASTLCVFLCIDWQVQICPFWKVFTNRLHVIANLTPFSHRLMADRLCLVAVLSSWRTKVSLKMVADREWLQTWSPSSKEPFRGNKTARSS